MDIKEQLQKLIQIKNEIKEAIAKKKVEIDDTTLFEAYPALIQSIQGGDDSSILDKIIDDNITKNNVIGNIVSNIIIKDPTSSDWITKGGVIEITSNIYKDFDISSYLYHSSITNIVNTANKTLTFKFTTSNDTISRQGLCGNNLSDDEVSFGIENNQFAIIRKVYGAYEYTYTEYFGTIKPNTTYIINIFISSTKTVTVTLTEENTSNIQTQEASLYLNSRDLTFHVQLGRGWKSNLLNWIGFTGNIDVNNATIQ